MPSDFFEKTVEDIIFDNQRIIHKYGLPKFRGTVFRQFVLPSGKKIDILSYDIVDGHVTMDVYELKRLDINSDAVCQAYNYFIEVTQFTAGRFKSVEIHIIMIGRSYDPVLMFEKMELPFSVYTYDYKLNGMTFRKHLERRQKYEPCDDFCAGLWAFGDQTLEYPQGQPDTVNLTTAYGIWKNKNPDSHKRIMADTGALFLSPIVREIIVKETVVQEIRPKKVKTEIFPAPLAWTKEFSASIPDDEHGFDFDLDMSDYEPEVVEADYSDYEEEVWEDEVVRPTTLTAEEKEEELQIFQIENEIERIITEKRLLA